MTLPTVNCARYLGLILTLALAVSATTAVSSSVWRAPDEIARTNCLTALNVEKDSDKILKTAIATEGEFAAHYLKKAPANQPWFQFLPGHGKILILAPHATSQIRENAVKRADAGTGSLAVVMNRLTGAPALYTFYQSPVDPNYYDKSDFKKKISDLIRELHPDLVLDLHTSAQSRPYDVDFGTRFGKALGKHPEYLEQLKQTLSRAGLTRLSENIFAADKNQTDTKWVSNLGTPCIQLEINETWLLSKDDKKRQRQFMQLLSGLVEFAAGFHH